MPAIIAAPFVVAAIAVSWWLFVAQGLRPIDLVLLPYWGYRLDALSLLFASSCVGVGALGLLQPGPIHLRSESSARRGFTIAGGLLLILGLLQVIFAAQAWGRLLGLELTAVGLLIMAVPGSLSRLLAGIPLLVATLSGALDFVPAAGLTPSSLPFWVVLAATASALLWSGCWAPPENRSAADHIPISMFAAAGFYTLVRTLDAGSWDGWTRGAVFAAGMLMLAWALLRGLSARGEAIVSALWSFTLALILIALGIGTPAAVAGGLVMLLVAVPGLFLALPSRPLGLRLLGAATLVGLPPLVGFVGIWLLVGGALLADYPLVVVTVPVGMALLGLAMVHAMRELKSGHTLDPPGTFLAFLLLLGGLAAQPFISLLLRPALNELAAGLPALREVREVSGLGLSIDAAQSSVSIWPITALAVCLGIALSLVRLLRHALKWLFPVAESSDSRTATPDNGPLLASLDSPRLPELPTLRSRRD